MLDGRQTANDPPTVTKKLNKTMAEYVQVDESLEWRTKSGWILEATTFGLIPQSGRTSWERERERQLPLRQYD